MEELYEADVMWPDNDDCPTSGASNGYASPKTTTRERGERAAPVEIPRAGRRRAGESLVDEEGAADQLIPPHVLVSRSGTVGNVAFSLCLGQGRTLKGRDLARVRDSVLRMTGFLEG